MRKIDVCELKVKPPMSKVLLKKGNSPACKRTKIVSVYDRGDLTVFEFNEGDGTFYVESDWVVSTQIDKGQFTVYEEEV